MRATIEHPIFPANPGSTAEVCYASPRTVGPQVEGHDGRKRKTYNSSRDSLDFSLDGFREEDLRAGGPCLCPIPVQHPGLPRSNSLCKRILLAYHQTRYQIRDILRSRGIDVHASAFELNHVRTPDITYDIPTVNILATRHSLAEPWLETAREIYTFLSSRGFPEFAVDISDPACDVLHSFPLLDEDVRDSSWDDANNALMACIEGEEILGFNLCRLGFCRAKEENPRTLLATVCEASDRDWTLLREKIVEVLDASGLSHFAVSIVKRCQGRNMTCPFCMRGQC